MSNYDVVGAYLVCMGQLKGKTSFKRCVVVAKIVGFVHLVVVVCKSGYLNCFFLLHCAIGLLFGFVTQLRMDAKICLED